MPGRPLRVSKYEFRHRKPAQNGTTATQQGRRQVSRNSSPTAYHRSSESRRESRSRVAWSQLSRGSASAPATAAGRHGTEALLIGAVRRRRGGASPATWVDCRVQIFQGPDHLCLVPFPEPDLHFADVCPGRVDLAVLLQVPGHVMVCWFWRVRLSDTNVLPATCTDTVEPRTDRGLRSSRRALYSS